jgi:hypothetical protein
MLAHQQIRSLRQENVVRGHSTNDVLLAVALLKGMATIEQEICGVAIGRSVRVFGSLVNPACPSLP